MELNKDHISSAKGFNLILSEIDKSITETQQKRKSLRKLENSNSIKSPRNLRIQNLPKKTLKPNLDYNNMDLYDKIKQKRNKTLNKKQLQKMIKNRKILPYSFIKNELVKAKRFQKKIDVQKNLKEKLDQFDVTNLLNRNSNKIGSSKQRSLSSDSHKKYSSKNSNKLKISKKCISSENSITNLSENSSKDFSVENLISKEQSQFFKLFQNKNAELVDIEAMPVFARGCNFGQAFGSKI